MYESSHVRQVSFSQFYAFEFFLLSRPLSYELNVLNSFLKECWDVEYRSLNMNKDRSGQI